MQHELKCEIPFFDDIIMGQKSFEVRKNDRNFKLGDILNLREFIPVQKNIYYNDFLHFSDPSQPQAEFTGRECKVKVIYILRCGEFGIDRNYVIMGIELLKN